MSPTAPQPDYQARSGNDEQEQALTSPRTLPLRTEQPPDDAAVVLRAGLMSAANVHRAAHRTFDLYGLYGISVEGVIDMSVHDAARTSERIARYRQIRLSTFGRTRSAGFALLATFDYPHFTLVLPDLSELTLTRLDRCFDPPIPTPGRDQTR